jgi:enoyl-CoA hydratase
MLAFPRAHVALVTLNRPEARNAVNASLAEQLGQIVQQLEADPNIFVVVLTGTGGKAFSAGADLKEVANGGLEKMYTAAGGFAGFVNATRDKPWIAAVDGMALAGGFEIALACDLIIASTDAEFALPEVMRGLLAAAGGVYRVPRALPRALALELIVTGRRLNAQRAVETGLVNLVVGKEHTVSAALDLASQVCENAPLAVRESLKIARRAYDLDDAALAILSAEAQTRLMATMDFIEGPRAFIEKRKPVWLGK